MKRKNLALVAAGLVMIGAITVRPAMAYFTDSHEAVGKATVYIGDFEIEPDEKAYDWTKEVAVKNTGNYDVFVRVQAICGEAYKDNLTYSGEGWTLKTYKDENDNEYSYYEYNQIVKPGETSGTLTINIKKPDDFDFDAQTFNVVIVEEATNRTQKDADGNLVAKWDEKIMERQEYQAKFGEKPSESQTETPTETQPEASTETETQQTTDTTENNEGGNE